MVMYSTQSALLCFITVPYATEPFSECLFCIQPKVNGKGRSSDSTLTSFVALTSSQNLWYRSDIEESEDDPKALLDKSKIKKITSSPLK